MVFALKLHISGDSCFGGVQYERPRSPSSRSVRCESVLSKAERGTVPWAAIDDLLKNNDTPHHLTFFHPFRGIVDLFERDPTRDELIQLQFFVHLQIELLGHIHAGTIRTVQRVFEGFS